MLLGRHYGWLFRLGDKLLCRLENITPASGDISLSWICGGVQQPETAQFLQKKNKKRAKGQHKATGRRRR